jgi:hypothetical protein
MTAGPAQPVLLVNPRSGGGKAARLDLVAQCRARGIEAIMFEPGDDLTMLATAAVRDGADALGMAGGDGSQAAVAAVAAEHGLPYVCIPAGTRNHFALDLGIDATDVAGALDAFLDGQERRIDLGRVNGRLFVNNVAMGVYGAIVQSPATGPQGAHGDQHAAGAGRAGCPAVRASLQRAGRPCHDSAVLVLVSNNHRRHPRPRRGTRGDLDGGVLGVIALAGPPPRGLTEWSTPTFRVDSATPIALGIDGESVEMEPPLDFELLPLALRIRTPPRRRVARTALGQDSPPRSDHQALRGRHSPPG